MTISHAFKVLPFFLLKFQVYMVFFAMRIVCNVIYVQWTLSTALINFLEQKKTICKLMN